MANSFHRPPFYLHQQHTLVLLTYDLFVALLDFVGFEVLTAVSTRMAAFWVVAPCSLVEVYQRFRGPCCLHHQGTLLY
jgi:hypothetical protein